MMMLSVVVNSLLEYLIFKGEGGGGNAEDV